MDKLAKLRQKQTQLTQLKQEVEMLANSKELQRELAFEDELKKLLKKYGKTMEQFIAGTRSKASGGKGSARDRRRARPVLKVYVNPHNKERIATRGGNHKILKGWKSQYGAEEVERWRQS